jgi:hypothetical protein
LEGVINDSIEIFCRIDFNSNRQLQIAPCEPINVRILLEEDAILEKVTDELKAKGLKIKNVDEDPDY